MNIYWEIFGYIGTAIVIVSMMMTSLVRLRIINITGSIISTIYAVVGNAWPIVVMNISLMGINIYHLIRAYYHKDKFTDVPVSRDDTVLSHFLLLLDEDIKAYFPEYRAGIFSAEEIRLVFADGELAGILAGKRSGEEYHLFMDYAVKKYRAAFASGYIFSTMASEGVKVITAESGSDLQRERLFKAGFVSRGERMEKVF